MDLMWILILFYMLALVGVGYFIPFIKQKKSARLLSWTIAVATVIFSVGVSVHQPPVIRMLVIVFLQLVSMKIVVMVETYSGENRLNAIQWIAFSLGWFGMRPVLFESFPSPSLPFVKILLKGISRIAIGILLLCLSIFLEEHTTLKKLFVPQLFLLAGLSFVLHFGVLNLSTAMWRMSGVNVTELFQSPYKSRSLREFWGKRWNMAFSEMTALIAYRPLKKRIGIEKAMILSFLLSGLLHEIAISLPVMAGFGLPMLYFVIHAGAMQLEAHSTVVQKIIQHKWLSHVWVMSLLILPMPLLFHREFLMHVLAPLRAIVLGISKF